MHTRIGKSMAHTTAPNTRIGQRMTAWPRFFLIHTWVRILMSCPMISILTPFIRVSADGAFVLSNMRNATYLACWASAYVYWSLSYAYEYKHLVFYSLGLILCVVAWTLIWSLLSFSSNLSNTWKPFQKDQIIQRILKT